MSAYRFSRRRIWIWQISEWVLTDDHRVWRVAYLRGAL